MSLTLGILKFAATYSFSITNRFSIIGEHCNKWNYFKEKIEAASTHVLRTGANRTKCPWILDKTLEIIEHYCTAQLQGYLAKYKWLNHITNERMHAYQQKFWEDEASKLEDAASQKDLKQYPMSVSGQDRSKSQDPFD